jgi:hypothetical protein
LRAAIEEANAFSANHGGATCGISFNLSVMDPNFNGLFWTINLTGALPDITNNLTVSGPGAGKLSVKRNSTAIHRIFTFTAAGTVNILGLTMANGNVGSGGVGGILSNSTGTFNLTNCLLTGGFAKNGGGVINNGTMTFSGCTLDGNVAGNLGGGIENFGTATFKNCTLSNNSTTGLNNGGGIANFGTCNVTNCTFKGNSSGGGGGAIFNGSGTMNVSNCTIAGNTAASSGGGILSSVSTTNMKSSIVALNSATTSDPDVSGSFTPQGFNFIGKNGGAATSFPAGNPNANNDIVGTLAAPLDPLLDPAGLQNNGGPTLTIALLASSPALDKGTSNASTGPLTTDQRGSGYTRAVNLGSVPNAAGGDGTDIGAFEYGVTVSLISIARSTNDIVITFQASSGATYRLEQKDLSDPNATWQNVSGVNDLTPNSSGPAAFTHANGASFGKLFYRVRLL